MFNSTHSGTHPIRERVVDSLPVLLGAVLVLLVFFLVGCGGAPEPDAYGNFEATEVTVSAESAGRLVAFRVDEGDRLGSGEQVGLIDTTQLSAQREGLIAQRAHLVAQRRALRVQEGATRAQFGEAEAAGAVVAAQLATAEEELERTRRLFADDAATARELNEREGQVQQLRRQVEQARAGATAITAQAGVPAAQAAAIDGQIASIDAQLRQIADQLDNALVTNPVSGTVLTVIARQGESVVPGAPLYTVADLGTLRLRAYATGDQLVQLRIGMPVDVRVDDADRGMHSVRGEVIAVASSAEFTPTPIQTRDERADLVYAFLVRVANPDGRFKVGMPGEVLFLHAEIDDEGA